MFGSRKSFTALKSCYHRNVETFKQIFAFEVYLSRNPDTSGPLNGHATLGNYHDPTMARQVHLEQRLDEARNAGVPVANLNVKVIDHWRFDKYCIASRGDLLAISVGNVLKIFDLHDLIGHCKKLEESAKEKRRERIMASGANASITIANKKARDLISLTR